MKQFDTLIMYVDRKQVIENSVPEGHFFFFFIDVHLAKINIIGSGCKKCHYVFIILHPLSREKQISLRKLLILFEFTNWTFYEF